MVIGINTASSSNGRIPHFDCGDTGSSPVDAPILVFIENIRETYGENRFLYGDCFKLFAMLRREFPSALPYLADCHVYTRIGDGFYDITGRVTPPETMTELWHDRHKIRKACGWSVEKMWNHLLPPELLEDVFTPPSPAIPR